MSNKYHIYICHILFTLVCLPTILAQQSNKMVYTGNIWYQVGTNGDPLSNDFQKTYVIYSFSGDTTINSISYKKLQRQILDSIFFTNPLIGYAKDYAGAFRQDSLKVFFVPQNTQIEKLYCDFDLHVGDTIKYYYSTYQNIKVDSVLTVPFGSSLRKKFKLSNSMIFYDGIGNYLGLFSNFAFGISGGTHSTCFEQNGNILSINAWGINSGDPCTFVITDTKQLINLNKIQIFPNPTNSIININLSQYQNSTIEIINYLGKTILSIPFTNQVDVSKLSNGIYTLKINSIYTKFIKTD